MSSSPRPPATDPAQKLIAATPKKATIPILTGITVGPLDDLHYAAATDLSVPVVVCLDRAQTLTYPTTDRVMIKAGQRDEEGIVKLTLSAEMLEKLAKMAKAIGCAKGMNAVCLEIPTHETHRRTSADGPVGLDLLTQIRF